MHACREWAGRTGRDILGPFVDDGVGGAEPLDRRPALLDAVARLGPGDVLLVAKRDRLGRDPIAVAMIEAAVIRKKARIVSAAGEGTESDDPSAILMRRMVDAFAEYERLIIKARTRAALSAKQRRGERTGGVPYGLRLDPLGRRNDKGRLVELVKDPAEFRALARIEAWDRDGWSLRRIAAELDRSGIPTKNGKGPWRHTAVAAILSTLPRLRERFPDDQATEATRAAG